MNTHIQYEQGHTAFSCTHRQIFTHIHRPCLYPILNLLSSLYCDGLNLLCPSKPIPNYAAAHSQCLSFLYEIHPLQTSPPSHLFTIKSPKTAQRGTRPAAGGFNRFWRRPRLYTVKWLNRWGTEQGKKRREKRNKKEEKTGQRAPSECSGESRR